jgi:DNA-binding response OmpR family regulator
VTREGLAPAAALALAGGGPAPRRERHLGLVPPSAPEDDASAPAERPTGRRVLVVDDEASMRTLCRVNLELAGFEVGEARDGAEALALAESGQFDLILLDVMLPDIGGHDVVQRLAEHERSRDVPVVFLSARAAREDIRLAYQLGAVDYITKPFDPVGLGERVRGIVERVDRGQSEPFRAARLSELED